MEVFYFFILFSILLVFLVIWVFFCVFDGGQFDDFEGLVMCIFYDDDIFLQQDWYDFV